MKHESLISLDEAAFGFGTSKTVFDATSAPQHGDAADFITVPDAHLLFSGEFKHVGNDLKIIGEDGKSFLVTDYFKTDKHPTLRSPEGATLNGDLVDLLAGPLAPGQYAQAGAPQPGAAEAVGRVAVVTGNVTIIRNGVAITVNAGDVILKNDVVQTGAGAACGVAFNDGSTFNIAAGARLAINEFVYDPNGSANASLVTLIQGAATFVAGQIAKTGDMKVATPVATMGIRGTAVILDTNALDGRVTISVIDQRDNQEHRVEVFDRAGNLIATATSIGGRLVLTPTTTLDVIASFTNKTPSEVAQEFAAFQNVLSSYDAAKQFFPNLPDHTDANPKGTQHAQGTDTQPPQGGGGSKTIPDPVETGDPVKVVEVVFKTPTDTSNQGNTNNNNSNPDANGPGDPIIVPTGNPFDYSGSTTGVTITGTGGADLIIGSNFNDDITPNDGNDFVYAGGGGDTIHAAHGGGDDTYDGQGGDDTIQYTSAVNGVIFDLYTVNGVKFGTAEDATNVVAIGHDIFMNIEKVVGSPGDDIFILHDTSAWEIDAGAGFDIIKLIAGLDIYGEGGPEVSNFEMVDLTNGGKNVVEFEGGGIDENNPGDELRIIGDSQDVVRLTQGGAAGHWEFVSGGRFTDSTSDEASKFADHFSDDVVLDTYVFVDDYGCTLATAYIDADITVATLVEDGADGKGASTAAVQLAPGNDDLTYDMEGWTPRYYAFVDAYGLSWQDAQIAAAAAGGYLTNITSAGENDFIANIVADHVINGSTAAYIGGARYSNPVHWEWTNGAEDGQQFWQGGIDGTASGYTNWRQGEPNNYGGNESVLVMEGDGTWNDAAANYGQSAGYVIEFDCMPDFNGEIFTQFSRAGMYGIVTFDVTTGHIIYYLDNFDLDTQKLTEGQIVTETFDVAVLDGNDEPVTHTVAFKIAGANDAPVISIDDAHTEENENATTLSGLSVSDVDNGGDDEFHVTVVAQHGTLAMADPVLNESDEDLLSDSRMEFHATLSEINDGLELGVTYTNPESHVPGVNDIDMVTLTIDDQNGGTETINFIFNVFGEGGVTLTATAEKDVLFGTGEADTFVFDHDVGPQGIGHDVVTEFAADDKIDLVNFGYNDITELDISYDNDAQTALITLASNETISLEQIMQPLTNDNFNFFHV